MTREEKCKLFESKGYTYNPETGEIFGVRGKPVSRITDDGYNYLGLRLNKKLIQLLGHHFAWWNHYGEIHEDNVLVIDHWDQDKTNNKISNLRLTTQTENLLNSSRADKTKGYTFCKRTGKWKATISYKRKSILLGYFDTGEEARQAYLDALKIYYPDRYTKVTGQSNEDQTDPI